MPAALIGVGLVAVAFAAYWLPGSDRCYNHFVWQALSFLHGTPVIDWPVAGPFCSGTSNDWMQDVYPMSEVNGAPVGALLPFPPLPAIVLMPFVAIWGLMTDIRAVSGGLGAIAVGVAWWALGGLRVSRWVRLATTVFFAFGTVFWYAAQLGTTWFFAHVCAVAFLLLSLAVALRADPEADSVATVAGQARQARTDAGNRGWIGDPNPTDPRRLIDWRQFAAGLLFGIACTARLTVIFGAPFLLFVGGGGTWLRRSVSAGLGAAIPVALLLAYNVGATGDVLHPGYEYQYEKEANGYQVLGYNPDWSIEDVRYLPQNLGIFLFSTPAVLPANMPDVFGTDGDALCTAPDAQRGIFDRDCPIALPRAIGMSILLTSPGYLLVLPALLSLFRRRSRLVAGSTLAVVAIAFVNLLHFSQGWVNFGYRFSNDFVVFALPLVAIGMARRGRVGWVGAGLIALSIAVNLWGVIWGNILGW